MSKKILSLLLAGFFVLGFTACDDDDDEQNLVQLVASTPELSTLLTVIQYIDENGSQADSADLSALLEIEIAEYTVFAPNNAAFDELDQTQDGVFDSADIEALENLLQGPQVVANALYTIVANHVLTVSKTSSELTDGEELVTVADAAGTDANFGLVVNLTDGVRLVPSFTPSAGTVVAADIEASNGVAHIIDSVLLDSVSAGLLGLAL
jgi:uncharacterized surface protein with fasciclin (FAS1) repeats